MTGDTSLGGLVCPARSRRAADGNLAPGTAPCLSGRVAGILGDKLGCIDAHRGPDGLAADCAIAHRIRDTAFVVWSGLLGRYGPFWIPQGEEVAGGK
jgi:hypothetical protein